MLGFFCEGIPMTDRRRSNVFVVGLDDFQRRQLETVRNADELAFHQLLPPEVVTRPEHRFADLLERARAQLEDFDGSVDAIVAHWDFPTSVLARLLGRERGLPVPPIEAVAACEHKLWARLEQRVSVPEVTPAFAGFDPFDDDALSDIDLRYPFWIKPIKSHSSQLGFRIESAEDFHDALPEIREEIRGFGDPFNEVLEMIELPEGIAPDSGNTCIAERIIAGDQATVEGAMASGAFNVHGVIDSPKDEHGRHFSRYEYPATGIPNEVQERMIDACERYLRHIGYDDAAWNIEFMYDEGDDQLWLVEANTRISQSHSNLFAKVDGMSNHEVALDIAFGKSPSLPHRRGRFAVAAKCFLWTEEMDDGIVRRVPSDDEITRVIDRFPETHVDIAVEVGDRLSELADQSSYRYDIGTLYLGAQSRQELIENYEICREMLPFEIEPRG
jgi:biotin carboxylase